MQYTVMPFGLRNAPATFQQLMRKVLGEVAHCEVYSDDIVVHLSTWPKHVQSLCEVFNQLKAASLTLPGKV